MKTSQLLSLALEAGEPGAFAKEIRGTGNENEMRGAGSGTGTQVTNLSFGSAGSSEYSYWSDGGVYELLGISSDCEPPLYENGGDG